MVTSSTSTAVQTQATARKRAVSVDEDTTARISHFVKDLEARLNKLEAYGISASIDDESIIKAYHALVEIRDNVMGEGKKAVDSFVAVVEEKKLHASSSAVESLYALEKKLVDIEQFCFENSKLTADSMNRSIQAALSAAATRLLTYDELPVPWQGNPYIKRGYRFSHNYVDCVVSMVRLHNETCNIWTHLIGFVAMLTVALFHWPTTLSWQESTAMDKFTMLVFLVAAMKCLVCSTVWHTFNGIAHVDHMKRFACVDYTGITVLIACSILTTEYTAFYCSPQPQAFYMIVTAICGLAGALFTWHPTFDLPEAKAKRITFFVSFAVAGGTGFIHAALLHGWTNTFFFYLPVVKSLLCYFFGVVVYALLIPERWCPGGIFDYFGMSHNLWHICVFGGIYYHYLATVKLIEGAREFSCGI